VRQPCRAFWRGSFLFTTNIGPRRRTTIEPGRAFSPRSEFLTFMISLQRFLSAPVTTSLVRSFRPAGRASRDIEDLPRWRLWPLHVVPICAAQLMSIEAALAAPNGG
jgi:hypothetical protein